MKINSKSIKVWIIGATNLWRSLFRVEPAGNFSALVGVAICRHHWVTLVGEGKANAFIVISAFIHADVLDLDRAYAYESHSCSTEIPIGMRKACILCLPEYTPADSASELITNDAFQANTDLSFP